MKLKKKVVLRLLNNSRTLLSAMFKGHEVSSTLKRNSKKLRNFSYDSTLGYISSKKRIIGFFSLNQKGFGFVRIGDGKPDLFVRESDKNTALDGDRVEVKIIDSLNYKGRRNARVMRVLDRISLQFLARLKRQNQIWVALPLNPRLGFHHVQIIESELISDAASGNLVEIKLENPKSVKGSQFGRVIRFRTRFRTDNQ